MSKPTDRFEDEAWWRAALAGEGPPHDGEIRVGCYKTTKYRDSPWYPILIWRSGPIDDDGNLTGDEKVHGLFDGELMDDLDLADKWRWCCQYPITFEEYNSMMNGPPEVKEQLRTTSLAEANPVF